MNKTKSCPQRTNGLVSQQVGVRRQGCATPWLPQSLSQPKEAHPGQEGAAGETQSPQRTFWVPQCPAPTGIHVGRGDALKVGARSTRSSGTRSLILPFHAFIAMFVEHSFCTRHWGHRRTTAEPRPHKDSQRGGEGCQHPLEDRGLSTGALEAGWGWKSRKAAWRW